MDLIFAGAEFFTRPAAGVSFSPGQMSGLERFEVFKRWFCHEQTDEPGFPDLCGQAQLVVHYVMRGKHQGPRISAADGAQVL